MNNLNEKIYDYLEKAGEPVSIGEICKEKEFAGMSRKSIAHELLEMTRQNAAFRNLKDGKAYYSANSSYEVGRNAVQENISSIKSVESKFEIAGEDLAKVLLNVLEIAEPEVNPDLLVDISEVVLSYSENKTVESDGFSMRIPDSFQIVNNDERDFVAYLANPAAEDKDMDLGGTLIQILPGTKMKFNNIPKIRLRKTYAELIAREWLKVNEITELFTTNAGMYIHEKFQPLYHQQFYFFVWSGEYFQQIHIKIDNIKGSAEKIKNKIIEIMEGVQIKQPLPKIKSLDDKSLIQCL